MKSSLSPSREPVIHEWANSLAVTLRGMVQMEDGGFNLNLRKPLEKNGYFARNKITLEFGTRAWTSRLRQGDEGPAWK
jgi:hypothetical protein